MSKRVAVSIVNYVHADDTIECVKSLLVAEAFTNGDCLLDIWVVDNFSSISCNGLLENSLGNLANVHLISLADNLGFAAGHNKALAEIMDSNNFDFVWLLNSDCKVDEGAIQAHLDACIQEPDVAIWGSTLLEADGETIQCAGGCFYSPWLSTFKQYGAGQKIEELSLMPVPAFDYIAGASLFFPITTLNRLAAIKDVRGDVRGQFLNEDFFLYFEELDLVQQLGGDAVLGWCKNAKIIHIGGASTGTGTGKGKSSAIAVYHSTLSALIYTWRYHRYKLCFMGAFRFAAKLVQLGLSGNLKHSPSLLQAYLAFFKWWLGNSNRKK